MNSAVALEKAKPADLEGLAFDLLQKELKEIVQISISLTQSFGFLQSRVKTQFPKTCAKCGVNYRSFEDFYFSTVEIPHGTVSYPVLNDDFYLHRNCKSPCDSTLVVVFTDRRDESLQGSRRRQLFETCLSRLQTVLLLDEDQSRELLLDLLSKHVGTQDIVSSKCAG